VQVGVTIPSRTAHISAMAEYARLADNAGFDSAWHYEVFKNPFTMLALGAAVTERVTLATGLASAFSRSPFEAANAAADLDELSDGRMVLGIGTGVPEFLTAFHSTDGRKPLSRISEYIDVLRLSWSYLDSGVRENYEGEFYRFAPPKASFYGTRDLLRTNIPVYLAAMGPNLQQLCGEKADGWLGYFTTRDFMEDVVRPNIERGARRAGRDASQIDLVSEVVCSVSPDRKLAIERAKRQLGFYLMHPVSNGPVETLGLQDAVADLRAAARANGPAAFVNTDERLVDALSISGTPEEARQKLAEYRDVVPHVVLHTPYVPPFTAEESDDAYRNIIATFGPNADTVDPDRVAVQERDHRTQKVM